MSTMPDAFRPLDPDTLPHLPETAAVNRRPAGLRPYPVAVADLLDDDMDAAVERLRAELATEDTAARAIPRPRRVIDLTVYAVALIAVLCSMVGALMLPAPAAQAATAPAAAMGPGLNLRAAPHHTVSPTLHAGYWDVRDARGVVHHMVCISYNRWAPDGTAAAFSAALPTPSREADARLKTAANLTTGIDGASGAVLWFTSAHILVDDPAARSKDAAALRADLPTYERAAEKRAPGIGARIKALLVAAATHAPYVVTRTLKGAVPGQIGQVAVTVHGSNGRPAAGLPLTLAVTGGTPLAGGRAITDKDGRAILRFASTALGQSSTVSLSAPSSTKVWSNSIGRGAGKQVVIGGGFRDVTRYTDVAELCPVEASHRTVCPCKKSGSRDVTATFTAGDVTGWYRGYVLVNGHEAGTIDLAAGESGDVTAHVTSGQDVEIGYRIYGTAARTGAALYEDTLDAWSQR